MRWFRRKQAPLGTMDGNASALDEVLNEPPHENFDWVTGDSYLTGPTAGERAEAVHTDLETDMNSDFDSLDASEDRMFDAFEHDSDTEE